VTKKEALTPQSLLRMFEEILCDKGLFCDSNDWRDLRTHCHVKWLDPLIEIGAIKKTGEHPAWPEGPPEGARQYNYHNFAVTPEGMNWWAIERVKGVEESTGQPININVFAEWRGERPPIIDGKGIGSPFWVFLYDVPTAAKCIRDGYFSFHEYYWGNPRAWHTSDALRVSLTRKGMEYFDSVPRLVLECA